MGLFKFFKTKTKSQSTIPSNNQIHELIDNLIRETSIPQMFYHFSYTHMPNNFFADPDKILQRVLTEKRNYVISEYIDFCMSKRKMADKIYATQIQIDSDGTKMIKIAIITFPIVPDETQEFNGMQIAILTPRFVALLKSEKNFYYFVYGKNPLGSLTLRQVNDKGVNSNLGIGSGNTKESFMADITKIISN